MDSSHWGADRSPHSFSHLHNPKMVRRGWLPWGQKGDWQWVTWNFSGPLLNSARNRSWGVQWATTAGASGLQGWEPSGPGQLGRFRASATAQVWMTVDAPGCGSGGRSSLHCFQLGDFDHCCRLMTANEWCWEPYSAEVWRGGMRWKFSRWAGDQVRQGL